MDIRFDLQICEALRKLHQCEHFKDWIRFTTTVQAPSGSLIRVFVRPSGDRWIISDNGTAFTEAVSAGLEEPRVNLNVRRALRAAGMKFVDGAIETPPLEIGRIQQGVVAVANLSRDVAEALISIGRDETELTLDRRARRLLVDRFHTWVSPKPVIIRGDSEVDHKFDTSLDLPDGRKVLIDTVNHHRNSINSVVVANLDVKNLNDPRLIQRIVFDPGEDWKVEDLNLLKAGALPVAISDLPSSIEKLAA